MEASTNTKMDVLGTNSIGIIGRSRPGRINTARMREAFDAHPRYQRGAFFRPGESGTSTPAICALSALVLGAGVSIELVGKLNQRRADTYTNFVYVALEAEYGIPPHIAGEISGIFDGSPDVTSGLVAVIRRCERYNRQIDEAAERDYDTRRSVSHNYDEWLKHGYDEWLQHSVSMFATLFPPEPAPEAPMLYTNIKTPGLIIFDDVFAENPPEEAMAFSTPPPIVELATAYDAEQDAIDAGVAQAIEILTGPTPPAILTGLQSPDQQILVSVYRPPGKFRVRRATSEPVVEPQLVGAVGEWKVGGEG